MDLIKPATSSRVVLLKGFSGTCCHGNGLLLLLFEYKLDVSLGSCDPALDRMHNGGLSECEVDVPTLLSAFSVSPLPSRAVNASFEWFSHVHLISG